MPQQELPKFPTGSTVPFPYESPYPQQTALMDTLLECLQQKDHDDSTWRQTNDSHSKNKKKPRAAVMMLESPTGTGKSLSLACSAMAWLKYCEQRDLTAEEESSSKENDKKTNDANTTSNATDWWNAWVPPDQKQTEQEWSITRQTAQESRAALQEELELWRSKLQKKNSEDNINNDTSERVKQRREYLARSAIHTAKMAENSGPKRRVKRKKETNKPDDFCATDMSDDSDIEADKNPHRQPRNTTTSTGLRAASVLLDGNRLDGSHRNHQIIKSSDDPPKTISHVAAGSGVRKIIYAARTHSQLSQFVGELKRTTWGETTRVVALGGRQLLCGNTALKKKHPTGEANLTEACLDLKKESSGKTKRTKGCPLLESKEAVATLGMHLLTTPTDIEDAARMGKASHTCAYYASRKALAAAEVVVLPYSMLLSRSTRQSVGLDLHESLVIVDEAHNLPEQIRELHSETLTLHVVQAAMQQLTRYMEKYLDRFKGESIMILGNLRKLLKAFSDHLTGNTLAERKRKAREKKNRSKSNKKEKESTSKDQTDSSSSTKKRTLQSTNEFMLELRMSHINTFQLQRYLEESRLAQKLLGFTQANESKEGDSGEQSTEAGLSKHVSAMSFVQKFLEKLNLSGREGKVVTEWPAKSDSSSKAPTIRFVLLQPASCFDNVVEEAHALALVGGTLSPFGHVAAELLASDEQQNEPATGASLLQLSIQADRKFQQQSKSSESSLSMVSSRFAAFTCDHVIDKSRVFFKCLSMGPNRQKFDFRHQSRMASDLCQDLGRALLQLCQAVPNGLVVFLPSYSYEAHLVQQWHQSGLYDKLNQRKTLFREPKRAQQLDSTLQQYAKHAAVGEKDGRNGALLLSVIGGKMSEGINLSNNLARGVVVVGLPYPDCTDPILREKMANIDQCGVGGISGQAYYQNLCMRAVNQSVGRAIRHANDYAAVFLCDYRYAAQQNVWSALPKWLRNSPSSPRSTGQSFGSLTNELEEFFSRMKGPNNN
ncbi:helicase CHL1 [Seminavis robusta]|uniref:Helicase CHL1 n=1 Tax=Seminavis robusta TaxID=568900 RepID=A0A9N8DA73_9STRA|nr:helicase CHL1 [Seminavis robusta]|eukprot:Sro13_g010240.1 helicase CHL1 (1001) ;mRNA; r:161274-164377